MNRAVVVKVHPLQELPGGYAWCGQTHVRGDNFPDLLLRAVVTRTQRPRTMNEMKGAFGRAFRRLANLSAAALKELELEARRIGGGA